jgi:cellulose synthase operon protein C
VGCLWRTLVPLVLIATVADPSQAFNARGRERKPPKTPTAGQKTPKRPTTPAAPTAPKEEPTSDALIARYEKIVLEQPGAPFPLQRLAALYRERDGNLDKLIAAFQTRALQPGPARYGALVALAGIYVQANRYEQAEKSYEEAIALAPKDPLALLALGRLHDERGNKERASELLERALPLISEAQEREQTLRQLMLLQVDRKNFQRARELHEELVRAAKGSFFVRAELGRELLTRGQYPEAQAEFERLVKAAAGDHRALAPALKDLGVALTRQGKHEEALKALQKALDITGNESGIRREVLEAMVEVHRGQQRLPALIELLEKEKGRDYLRTKLLAGLYEETGRIEKAIETYRAAIALDRNDIDSRLKLVQLLQIQGELAAAIVEHKALVKAAPHNPDFVLQLAEALLQQGDKKAALAELQELERRSTNDEQILAALVDFYERVGETQRSMRLLQRLAEGGGVDPQHVIELGNRYYQEGDQAKAEATWKRILVLQPDRARAEHALGEVYLEHDMAEAALVALEEAVRLQPAERRYRKSLALALERTGSTASKKVRRDRHDRARKIWEQLLTEAGTDHALEQEARQHIVTLWSLAGSLNGRLKPLERNLAADPPDLSAGRLLGEMYLRMRRLEDAERVLTVVTQRAPGDVSSYLRLERVLVMQRKLAEAIVVLQKLVEAEPKRAREYYQRMSQYAAESYRDDDAIEYARRAVELGPDDAEGHKNLADMYRKQDDVERAIAEYRKAIAKNDRLFPVYFDLAELLFGKEEQHEADLLLRRVMRSAVDEELIARATRLSMQINLGEKTLESLEQELLPIALSNPQRPVYRRLLVEIYGALAFPLVQKLDNPAPAVREGAHEELRRIGQRAVKPLLDALSDPRDTQQRVAIELLTLLENKSATAALYAYAISEAEPELRVRAMIAAGAPADAGMLPRFERLLAPGGELRVDEGDPVSIAVVWGVSRLDGAAATRFKLKLLEAEAPSARALAALSLGLFKVHAAEPALSAMLAAPEQGPVARAAAAYALGELGSFRQEQLLLALSQSVDDRLRGAALTTLARGKVRGTEARLAEAIVYGREPLRRAAIGAASVFAGGSYQPHPDPLRTPRARVELEPILQNFGSSVSGAEDESRALLLLSESLSEACRSAVQSSAEHTRTVASALLGRAGKPAFGELTARIEELEPTERAKSEAAAERIAAAVVEPFVALAGHPAAGLRATAIEFLGTRGEPKARSVLVRALSDEDSQVQRAALLALEAKPHEETLSGVSALLQNGQSWATRLGAARALAAYDQLGADAKKSDAYGKSLERLAQRASEDENAFVREAALVSLWRLSAEVALPVARKVAEVDPEPRVVAAAKRLLASGPAREAAPGGTR